MTAGRLATGGLIDRTRPMGFRFDGRRYAGFAGDTLASALLANNVRLLGRSFKYHRPRGLLGDGAEEPNALVELGEGARREPNTRATAVPLFEGLVATSQNRWPSLRADLRAVNGLFAPFLAAGFYYKTFMGPASWWEKLYEPAIRRAAGLGRAAGLPDPDLYERLTLHADTLVIGGGMAGLSAARDAARDGRRVVLCEADTVFGGRARDEGADIAALLADLAHLPTVRLLARTTVFGLYDHGVHAALERVFDGAPPRPGAVRQRLIRIVAPRSILATGAVEQPLLFADNDRPGIMLASAVRRMIARHAVRPGSRAVLAVNNDRGRATEQVLAAAGIDIAAVLDTREGGFVTRARGGAHGLTAVDAVTQTGRRTIPCDLLAVSGGFAPQIQLAAHLDHPPRWDATRRCFVPDTLPPGMEAVGDAAGDTLPETGDAGETRAAGKVFVDFQHDVTVADLALAVREGFAAPEHAKRYTTLGMATDQGRTATRNATLVLAGLTGRPPEDLAPPRARPPVVPVALGALAGASVGKAFRPTRLPPSHDWAARRGAAFIEAGTWRRAQYYPRPEERGWYAPATREARMVRDSVGICDVSTLGKIDVQGTDAATFLDRIYASPVLSLRIGRTRYGLMLREDGFVMDDGTLSRIGDQRYLVTTTTANAETVFRHMQFCRQRLWPDLDVALASVTDQFAQVAVAGPLSRAVLATVLPEADVSDAALPFMASVPVSVFGAIPGRVYRVSYSGERAYEVALPARHGERLMAALVAAAEARGGGAYGTEALGILRIEKGHPAGGELSGRTTAADLGLARLTRKTGAFIGKALMQRPALADPQRPCLIGLIPADRGAALRAGAHLLETNAPTTLAGSLGHVTSAAPSPALGHWIALGLLRDGRQRLGSMVRLVDPLRGSDIMARVVDPVFVDPEGGRLRG